MKNILLPICLGSVATTTMAYEIVENQSSKPNILIILADDLGYRDTGFQGSKDILTPNIDKIAKSGVIFTDAHVSATSCSPSRAGLMTGRYQQRFGHENNCPPYGKGMNTGEKTMADLLKKQGYKTAIIGKWHLGDTEEFHPLNRGFDYFYGLPEGSRSYFYKPKGADKPGDPHAIYENRKQVKFDGYLTDVLGDKCIEFIDRNKKKPFFTYLSFTAPHTPMHAKKDLLEKFKNDRRPKLKAMMWSMDLAVGKVMACLEKNGLKDNTIVYFLSDNGGSPASAACNWPLNGFKGNVFEGGHRVPFVMSWPKMLKGGKTYKGLTSAMDILPTSLIAAGGTLPTERPLDGVDLMPHLTGENTKHPHKQLFFKYENVVAMREGRWKIQRISEKPFSLFNTANDIGEKKNLLNKRTERVQKMLKDILEWEQGHVKPHWSGSKYYFNLRPKVHQQILEGKNGAANTVQRMNKYK